MRQLARTLVLAFSFGGLMSGSAEAASRRAASGAPQPAQDATTAPAEKTKAQLALEPIEQDFRIVYQSLQN